MMHGSDDLVVLLNERADAAPLGPAAPVMRAAADEILSLREYVAQLLEVIKTQRGDLDRYERLFGSA